MIKDMLEINYRVTANEKDDLNINIDGEITDLILIDINNIIDDINDKLQSQVGDKNIILEFISDKNLLVITQSNVFVDREHVFKIMLM